MLLAEPLVGGSVGCGAAIVTARAALCFTAESQESGIGRDVPQMLFLNNSMTHSCSQKPAVHTSRFASFMSTTATLPAPNAFAAIMDTRPAGGGFLYLPRTWKIRHDVFSVQLGLCRLLWGRYECTRVVQRSCRPAAAASAATGAG